MIVLVFNTKEFDSCIPSVVVYLLHEFDDVFSKDFPSGLPSIKGIEHQIYHTWSCDP